MKLTSVEIHPESSSEVAVLSFRDPGSTNPYNVKSILGLDAEEIIPKFYGSSGSSKFYNLSLQNREIIIKIGLNPRYGELETYSDLRDSLYKMIASSRTGKLQLQFKNGSVVVAAISGFVSKFETPLFEKSQEVQLTIACDEPMLKALDMTEVDVSGLDPASTNVNDTVSTAPHGFKFAIIITSDIDSIIINPSDNSWTFEVSPSGGFQTGDVLYYSSEYNDKYLYLLRDEDLIHLADTITPGSIWPIIFPGENVFMFSNPSYLVWDYIMYYPTYWGV